MLLFLFYDLLITEFLIVAGLVLIFLARDRWGKKQTWAKKNPKISLAALTVIAVAIAVVLYGSFIEPRILVVTKQSIVLPAEKHLQNPLRIALVSDFHLGQHKGKKSIARIAKKILSQKPELVLIAGDFFYMDEIRQMPDALAPLKELSSQIPVFAVFGNHEYGVDGPNDSFDYGDTHKEVRTALEAAGVTVLVDEGRALEIGGDSIYLIGADDFWAYRTHRFQTIAKNANGAPILFLAHNPSYIHHVSDTADIMLAAHTHGGQIRLPFIGPLASPKLYEFPKKYFKGLSQWGKTQLFVTSGAGETGPRARFMNPPEIALITIQ